MRSYSLLSYDASVQTFTIHRLVQSILREGLPTQTQQRWQQRVISAVAAASPDITFDLWSSYERLLPHALLCATWIEQLSVVTSSAAFLLNQAGYYLKARGRYGEAEPLFERALAIREQQLGPLHLDTATSLNNLALLYKTQGKYAQAEPL